MLQELLEDASMAMHNIGLTIGAHLDWLANLETDDPRRDSMVAALSLARGTAARLSDDLDMPGARGDGPNVVRLRASQG